MVHKTKESEVVMSSAQDENAATRERGERGTVRADCSSCQPVQKAFQVHLFKD